MSSPARFIRNEREELKEVEEKTKRGPRLDYVETV
jgi:hypothetical protein